MIQSNTASVNRIGYISEQAHVVSPDTRIDNVKSIFDDNKPISAVVVTQNSKAVGLVMNIHMNLILSQRYGFSLYSKKPIDTIMDQNPMIVNHDENIEDVAAKAMQRENERLYDHIIIQKNERLYGIVAVRTILNSLVETQKEKTSILERYATRLEQEDSEKKEAIQSLEESRKMLQQVIDAIPHAVFWKDRNSVYLGCNTKFAQDAGIENPLDIKGITDKDLPWTDKEAQLFVNQDKKIMETEKPGLNLHQVQTNAQGRKRFLNTNKVPLHDADQSVIGVLCFYQDITKQLHDDNERLKLQMQLARAQKMEAIGRLAGGVAHDLNNILSGIVNYPEMIMMDLPRESRFIRPLKTIQNSGIRAAAVVQDLLTLARRGVTKKEMLNINNIIYEYLNSPESLNLAADYPLIKIKADTEQDLMSIEGSPVHLTKTIMNLVNNSVESIDGPGRVVIKTWNEFLTRPLPGYRTIQKGHYVGISIKDTGSGIPQEDIEKIFEPFYTKKKMGRSGTGLGMAVVWGTVKDLNGYIDIASQLDDGTLVTIYLPAKKRQLELLPDSTTTNNLLGHGERILVIDDVSEQREIAKNYLKRLNYKVQTFESGEQALEYVKTVKADLLVLDMIMEPGMDGLETYMKILEIHPDQQAIITSGFSESERVKKAQDLGAGSYLRKPYNFEKLGLAVKKELQKTA